MLKNSFQTAVPTTLVVFNVGLKETTSGSIIKIAFGKDVLAVRKV